MIDRLAPLVADAAAARVRALGAGLILDHGDDDPRARAWGRAVAEAAGVPYHLVTARLTRIGTGLRAAGEILEAPARAEALAALAEDLVRDTMSQLARLGRPRVRIHYACGLSGLDTAGFGTLNSEVLDLVGAEPVPAMRTGRGVARLSHGQVRDCNSALVVALDPAFARAAVGDPAWAGLAVATAPQRPFNWLDRPPSINRVLGLRWLARLLHGPAFEADLVEEARAFFALAYHGAPERAAVAAFLAGTAGVLGAVSPGRATGRSP